MKQTSPLHELANEVLKNPANLAAREELQSALQLDDLNFWYFLALHQSKRAARRNDPLWIHENFHETLEKQSPLPGKLIAYPTAIAPAELLSHLPFVEYRVLTQKNEKYLAAAQRATLWVKKMQAGTGSTMTRSTYLLRQSHQDDVRLGAKGTDLFVNLPKSSGPDESLSLAETQLLQAIREAKSGSFHSIIFHDLVSSETENSISRLWDKKAYLDPGRNYGQLIRRSGRSFQAYLPTLNENEEFSFNRQAPGGHALFALEAIRAAYLPVLRPETQGSPLVSVIGNGEDLNSTPDPTMVGWMIAEKIPIAMITTEKTPNDLKGGQIALVKRADGSIYITIIELAQAKEAGQEALFEKLGLEFRRDEQIAFFNTNMALFNYEVLAPKLKSLVTEIGETPFLKLLAPDLISNTKEQVDTDGITRKYVQLEGAMGSCLLNLDRYWRGRFNEPLVHFINIDRFNRTRFFSPIKTAFDFFMQFHSDLFTFDTDTMRLIHNRPGTIPSISLKDPSTKDLFYQDVQNVLDCFEGASLVDLSALKINGQISIRGGILKGKVSITNRREALFDLAPYFKENPALLPQEQGRPTLENIQIEILPGGEVSITHQ